MAADGVESETPHGAGQGVEGRLACRGVRRRQRRGPRGAALARAQNPHQASEGVLGEAVVEFDDATGYVQNVARLGARGRGRDQLDKARLGGRRRGRIRRGAASEMHTPEVQRASVEVVLTSPVPGRKAGGGGIETSLSVEGIADLARHRGREWAPARSPSSERSLAKLVQDATDMEGSL